MHTGETQKGTGAMVNGHEPAVLLEAQGAADAPASPRPARRDLRHRLRLSVRGLLVLVLLTGCGMGWLARVVRTGQAQRRSVAAVYQAGGWVLYDTEWDARQSPSTWKPRWPRWLVERLGVDYCANVVFINLHDRGTDSVLAHVGRLIRLRQLHRLGPAVTDAGLAHLGQLSDLQFLSLDGTQATDAGLAHLKGLKGLKWLKLTKTSVTDAGVAKLRESLPALKSIR
jgi:hypothetical protein